MLIRGAHLSLSILGVLEQRAVLGAPKIGHVARDDRSPQLGFVNFDLGPIAGRRTQADSGGGPWALMHLGERRARAGHLWGRVGAVVSTCMLGERRARAPGTFCIMPRSSASSSASSHACEHSHSLGFVTSSMSSIWLAPKYGRQPKTIACNVTPSDHTSDGMAA